MGDLIESCGGQVRVEGKFIRIARLELDKYEFLADPAAVVGDLQKCGARIDLFTFLQKLPEIALPKVSPNYAYPMEWDNLAVLSVSTFDHWWNRQIRSLPRNRARQAEKKGVSVREVRFDDALVRGIWRIYNECPVRQGVRFLHYGRDLDWVGLHAGTFLDRSIFIGAFLDDSLIGFIKLVTNQTRIQANTMHIVSMTQHRDKAPTNALIAQAVRSCAERGIRYLVYQNFNYGNKQGDSLSHFKEINGFQRIDVPRYYIPLTRIGRVAFRFGLHRRLADHLPQSVAAKLRDFRKTWYNRKFRSVAEA